MFGGREMQEKEIVLFVNCTACLTHLPEALSWRGRPPLAHSLPRLCAPHSPDTPGFLSSHAHTVSWILHLETSIVSVSSPQLTVLERIHDIWLNMHCSQQ